MDVVRLTAEGVARVLNGREGMTFPVDRPMSFGGLSVRDYRYPGDGLPYQRWSLARRDYEPVAP